jgi:uncharacterized protein YcbK (DUF882 family)
MNYINRDIISTEKTAYDALKLSIIYFLKRHKYIKDKNIDLLASLADDLKLTKTDIHIVCNYVSVTYNVIINPMEARSAKTFGDLTDFLYQKIQNKP